MAALAKGRLLPDVKLFNSTHGGYIIDYVMEVSDTIYKGSFVELLAAGQVQPANVGSALQVIGIALETVTASAVAGAFTVPLLCGALIEHAVTGSVIASIGIKDVVYASDDQTLTTTVGTNALFGWFVQLTGTATGLVQMAQPGQTVA